MSKYVVWDKESNIYTPSGAMFTAEEWIAKYPWCNNPIAVPVVAGGIINGAFMGELSSMVDVYTRAGADFTDAETDEKKLAVIEEFEEAQSVAQNAVASTEERTAAALEALAMASLPDVE